MPGYRLPAGTFVVFFFFNDTATTEIYTLSLHDALPICAEDLVFLELLGQRGRLWRAIEALQHGALLLEDRKSTRLNSSHSQISYAVFCLKKKTSDLIYHHHTTSYLHQTYPTN